MSDFGKAQSERSSKDVARSLLAAITASSHDAVIGEDLNGVVTSWNKAAEHLFGFTAENMIGVPITRIIPANRLDEEAIILDKAVRGESSSHLETGRLAKDGRVIPVSVTVSPIRDDSGRVIGISKIARDLSGLHHLNDELQRRGALLQSILDTIPEGLIVIDRQGIVQYFGAAAERMFGFAPNEVIGHNIRLLMPRPYADAHDGYIERYLTTGERRVIGIGRVVVGQRKNGTTFPMELQIGEVLVPGGHFFTGFVRDLTERQDRERRVAELQSELIHVSRLSELGQMVSALAHEVNQPLTAIANYIRGIRRLLTPENPPALHEAIERIGEQADRAHSIIQGLHGFVKKEARPRRVESLVTIIQEISALALVGTGRSMNLDLQIAADATHAYIDKVQIQQVLLNLLRNAVEAMANLSVRRLTVATARRGDRVEIRVSDTGPGLPEAVRAHLFQPFVTTKPDGLGVGLSICSSIVEAHGGELIAPEAKQGGAVFCFTVPATP